MGELTRGFGLGLLGAGLFGLLTGNGFFSGLGSFMGILGFLLQMALIFFIVRWAFNYFRDVRDRQQPIAMASGPPVDRINRIIRSANAGSAGA